MKRLDVVAGPNGAGKSTFVELTLAPLLPGSVFVNADVLNADVLARQRCPQDALSHAYEAARVAADLRSRLIEMGRSLIAQTVFSHPSKLALIRQAHDAGFTVVTHILLIPEELAVQRVRHRVVAGGRDVPEAKIRDRYQRLFALVAEAAPRSDTATEYDNSQRTGPRVVAQFSGGDVVGAVGWPAWTPPAFGRWSSSRWPSCIPEASFERMIDKWVTSNPSATAASRCPSRSASCTRRCPSWST